MITSAKPLLLGLLLLSSSAASPSAPPAQVQFTPLSKAAYMAAKCVNTKPRVTFPLRKQGSRLVVPTAKGKRVFADVVIDDAAMKRGHGEAEEVTHTYLGYLPDFHCHLIRVQYYEMTQWLLLSDRGHLAVL